MCLQTRNTLGQQLFSLKNKADSTKMADACYQQGSVQRLPWFVYWRNHQTIGIGGEVKEVTEADKVTKAGAFTHQQSKRFQVVDFKSTIVVHATSENHTLDWDNAKKLEQVPDWRMRGIKEVISTRSTPHNFNHTQRERHILPRVGLSPVSLPSPVSDNRE